MIVDSSLSFFNYQLSFDKDCSTKKNFKTYHYDSNTIECRNIRSFKYYSKRWITFEKSGKSLRLKKHCHDPPERIVPFDGIHSRWLFSYRHEKAVLAKYKLDNKGLNVNLTGDGEIRCLLPVFRFNGQERTKVTQKGNVLEIAFQGYVCRYTVKNGTIKDLKRAARNRNGHYDTFAAEGMNNVTVQIAIEKL